MFKDIEKGVITDDDNNIYLAGSSGRGIPVYKFNSQGIEQWSKKIDRPEWTYGGVSIVVDNIDGSIYVGGGSGMSEEKPRDGGEYDFIKLDNHGNIIWEKQEHTDYYMGVVTYTVIDTNTDVYTNLNKSITKFSSDGLEQWNNRIIVNGVIEMINDNNNNLYVIDYISREEYKLIKYNSDGKEKWVKKFNALDYYSTLFLDSKNNIYITSENILIKISK